MSCFMSLKTRMHNTSRNIFPLHTLRSSSFTMQDTIAPTIGGPHLWMSRGTEDGKDRYTTRLMLTCRYHLHQRHQVTCARGIRCILPHQASRKARAVATALAHSHRLTALGQDSIDRTVPNSPGTTQLPYACVPTATSPVSYDVPPETPEPRIKRKRWRADPHQIEALNKMYARTAFPSTEERQQLAKDLNMSARRVQIWFQNKRQLSRQRARNPGNYETGLGDRRLYDSSSNTTSTPSFSAQGHIPTLQSSPSPILTSPDNLHPTLSSWIKNMDKLSNLIDRLQEIASSAPPEHQSQLLNQVVALRATSQKQKEHFVEFLKLSEEYANKHLLDISAEIQQESDFLDKLEGRLEAATKLRGEAADLQMFYESGTVATMENFRATALSRPLPEDRTLFSEVDMLLTEIRQCYVQLNKFWTEEISRASEALRMRRVDPTDFERWKNFHANLKQTIESWKNELPRGDAQALRRNDACSSMETDIGEKASSLSSAMGSLTSALDRLFSSKSLNYSYSGLAFIQRVYVKFAANSDMCLSFLRQCADYGEKVFALRLPSIASATSSVRAARDLRERTMRLWSEMTGVSVENAASVQGSRKFKSVYYKALRSEQKTTSGLNTLLEKLSSWVTVTDGHSLPDDAHSDVITLEELREQWVEARDLVSAALVTLKNEPIPQLFYRSAPLTSTRPISVMKRWMMNIVCFS